MSAARPLSALDRQLLNRIQLGFPLARDPYGELARELGRTRDEVHAAVCALRADGVVRRIGASYVPGPLGYTATLVAAQVEPPHLAAAAARAGRHPEVTHNYGRDHRLNLWFTVIAPSAARLAVLVEEVRGAPGVGAVHVLPARGLFKLRVDFHFAEPGQTGPASGSEPPGAGLSAAPGEVSGPLHKALIARTCGDIDESQTPFDSLATEVGLECAAALRLLCAYREGGLLRRFGAVLQHRAAGFAGNGMAVWRVPPERLEAVGHQLAAEPAVSHCYHRLSVPDWPYNLYAMVHGQDRAAVRELCQALARQVAIDDYEILFSTREFKKTSMVYFSDGGA